ncbi:MAG: glycosyltransferase family 4 protein [Candidatus Saccharibacteria bacterium]|nr:glycosyltransferase family 4 protein [Candidatus Saccharibacteria bacterium]
MSKRKVIIIRNAKSYDFGGGERYPVFLGEVLQKNDFYPVIVSQHPRLLDFAHSRSVKTVKGWWWSNQNWSGPRIILFPIYFLWQIALFFWYLHLFIRMKPDIIHIQSKDDFIAATWAGRILGKKVVWTDHADLKHIWKNIGIWYKNPVGKLVHWSARFANTITPISNSELSLISANLRVKDPIRKKMEVVYNGVNDDATDYPEKSSKNFTYCVVSRLVTDKGIGEAIEAFSRLAMDYPDDQLLVIGDGPESKKFESLAIKASNIKLLGYQKDPLEYIAKCDVFVHPAYHEGFGISLVEAGMLSKPIIASAVGGIVEIVTDHETGLLVKEKDVDSLQNAMKLLRDNKTLRDKLGKAARNQYKKRFQFDQIVKEKFIPIYEDDKK